MKVYYVDETHYGVFHRLPDGNKISGKHWDLINVCTHGNSNDEMIWTQYYILPDDYKKHRDEMDSSIPIISILMREFVVLSE